MKQSVKDLKTAVRRELLAIRSEIGDCERKQASEAMIKKLVSLASYRYAETVLLYTAIKGEPDVTRELMEAAIASGKRVAFPLCHPESCTLTYHYVGSYDELVLGNYGTKEPSESAPVYEPSPQKHDLLLVPGISYDKKGYRLGYGKGYYDRFLTLFGGTTVGVTFDKLFVPELPRGRYDQTVDVVLTEKGVFFSR